MTDFIKRIAICVVVGFFLMCPAMSSESARDELFFTEYEKYTNAKKHPDRSASEKNRTLDLHLSQITDIDKFKISAYGKNNEKKLDNTFAEKRVVALKDVVEIIRISDLHPTNKRNKTVDATEFFNVSDFDCILKIPPDFRKTFDALGNTVIYGENYYIVAEKHETSVKLDVCMDREGLVLRSPEEIILRLGGDFLCFEKNGSAVSHGITAYSFKSQNGDESFAEFFDSNRLCYLRTVKNLG